MSQTEDVSTEPVRWPIAPDGYIPNSVIRSWSRHGRSFGMIDSFSDLIFNPDWTSDDDDDDDDMNAVFWFNDFDDEEDEEEITFSVKRRRREEDGGTDRGEKDGRDEMGREDKKETELEEERKDETAGRVPMKQSTDLQTTTHLNNKNRNTGQDDGSSCSSRTLENFLSVLKLISSSNFPPQISIKSTFPSFPVRAPHMDSDLNHWDDQGKT